MADVDAIRKVIEPEIEALGYELVRIAFVGGQADPTLQVMAEKPDTRQLDLGDCERISRRLSEVLDALEEEDRDPIEGSYRLEVSSPGIDRPLTRLKDYDDWKGHQARITLLEPAQNGPAERKQFSGTIAGTGEGGIVHLEGKDGKDYKIPFDSISSAKLLLTDELIASTAPLSSEGADSIHTVED
jgi:ribosome maturation factor RimP